MTKCDVVIVGGGFVGYTAALALADLGFNVIILEAKKRDLTTMQQQDGRAIALAYTSCLLLKNLSVWQYLQGHASAINTVHTSQQGHFGKLHLRASEMNLDYLGQVIPAPMLGMGLAEAVQAHANIIEIAPAQLTDISLQPNTAEITYLSNSESKTITANLVFACDGTSSTLRQKFNLNTKTKDHQQQAIVANVDIAKPHENHAYERFTEQGTLALLPLKNNRMTTVLSVDNDLFGDLKARDDAAYLELLESLFGKKLGGFTNLGKRFTYPLQSLQCTDMQRERFLLLGNAVHTINPIAAQGLNLAMRDIAVLIDCIQEEGLTPKALQSYTQKVLPEHQKMLKFTDRLVSLAQTNKFKHTRSLGLLVLDNLPGAKHSLARTLAGLSEHRGKKLQAVQDAI